MTTTDSTTRRKPGPRPLGRVRANITLPPELVGAADQEAARRGIDRSALIEAALRRELGRKKP